MKTKKIVSILFSLLIISQFNSCDLIVKKKIEPVSEISTFPIFFFNGGQTYVHEINTSWNDPGVLVSEVKEGDNDLAHTLVIDDSEMDINTRGLYSIKYTATNSFGHKLTANRFVLVTDNVDNLRPIGGTYERNFGLFSMQISENDVKGFWDVTNIRDGSAEIASVIADLGNDNYIVALSLYKRKISNLRYVYFKGEATYNESASPLTITFNIYQVYEDGTPLNPDPQGNPIYELPYVWELKE